MDGRGEFICQRRVHSGVYGVLAVASVLFFVHPSLGQELGHFFLSSS